METRMSRNNNRPEAIICHWTSAKQLPWSFEITRWCWKSRSNLSDWQVHTHKKNVNIVLFFIMENITKCQLFLGQWNPKRVHSLWGFPCEPHYIRVDCSRMGDSKKWTQNHFWSPRLVFRTCPADKSFLGKEDSCGAYSRYLSPSKKSRGVILASWPNPPTTSHHHVLLIIPIHWLASSLCLLSTSKMVCGVCSGSLWLPSHHPGGCCILVVDEEITPLLCKSALSA